MKLDPKTLNLIVPVETESGETVYVHSMPIRRETFKRFFLVLSKTLNELYAQGLQGVAGPRVAGLMLQKVAEDLGAWDDVQNGLINEIRRLSNVQVLGPDGWKSLPLHDCLIKGILTEEEVEEAEGFIVFFTCIWHVHKKKEVSEFLRPMRIMWGTSTTSLNVSEYRASLPILTETETFLPTVALSSIPG